MESFKKPLLYVASRASLPERSAMWRALRNDGWKITSTWIDEAGPGETRDYIGLWHRIETEISRSDGLILYAERDDFPLKGALIEAGIAIGLKKPVRNMARLPVLNLLRGLPFNPQKAQQEDNFQ